MNFIVLATRRFRHIFLSKNVQIQARDALPNSNLKSIFCLANEARIMKGEAIYFHYFQHEQLGGINYLIAVNFRLRLFAKNL